MVKILVDTCVWLDLAKQHDQVHFVKVIEGFVDAGIIELLVPETIVREFDSNRARIVRDSNKGLSSIIKRAKEVVSTIDGRKSHQDMIDKLDDVNFKIPGLQESSLHTINAIDRLLKKGRIIRPSNSTILKAANRAINKKAPFHRNKNSMNDAVIIEAYGECVASASTETDRFVFVTHNYSDFSLQNGNANEPHQDFDEFFCPPNSTYSIDLHHTVKNIDPQLYEELLFKQNGFEEEPRLLSEILVEEDFLFEKVWYNRHLNSLFKEYGDVKLRKEHPGFRAAKRILKRHGKKQLGPWNDFEWGMINGKLSALRWILGDEWDMLDT